MLKNYLLCLCAVLLGINGCSQSQNSDQYPYRERDINTVKSLYKAYQTNDMKTAADLLADNYKEFGPAIGDTINKAETIDNNNDVYEYHSDIQYNDLEFYANDGHKGKHWVRVYGVWKVTHKETGKTVDVRYYEVFRIDEDGKIAELHTYWDTMDYWKDLDYEVTKKTEENKQ